MRSDVIIRNCYHVAMLKAKRPAGLAPRVAGKRKATTLRLDAPLQEGLALLQSILRRPINRLVNDAVRGYLDRRTAEVTSELEDVLSRLKAYRRSDPRFDKAIARLVDEEARLGRQDPVEGRPSVPLGRTQQSIRRLLRG